MPWRWRAGRQMRSGRARGQSDVDPGIDQDLCAPGIRKHQGAAGEFEQLARGQILFAKLNPVDACKQIEFYRGEQSFTKGQVLPVSNPTLNQGFTLVARASASPRSQIKSGAFGMGEGQGMTIRSVCFEPSPAAG